MSDKENMEFQIRYDEGINKMVVNMQSFTPNDEGSYILTAAGDFIKMTFDEGFTIHTQNGGVAVFDGNKVITSLGDEVNVFELQDSAP